jgi:hypothetical protein
MYGMQRATVYIPKDLKRALTQIAAARQLSEAELIREALLALAARSASARPRAPLFESGKANLAERVDEALAGFGER